MHRVDNGRRVISGRGGLEADVIQTDGHQGLVTMTPGHVSTSNSTNTPLGIDGVFTGDWEDITNYGIIVVSLTADQASATDGLVVQFSSDGTVGGIISSDNYTLAISLTKTFSFQAAAQYMRVVYTNGGIAQGSFNMQTVLKPYYVKPSSHRITDAIVGQDDAELVKAVITGINPAGIFVNGQFTTAGNSKISIEEFENAVSVNSNTQLRTTSFHPDGTAGQLIAGIDYVAGKEGIDASTESLQMVSYEHHEIHKGDHYNYADYTLGVASAATIEFIFITTNTTEWVHLVFKAYSGGGATVELYEGASGVTGGTVITPRNNNRNSVNTSGITLIKDPSAITSDGVRAAGFLAGAGKESGFISRDKEFVLKQNETYLVRITSLAASNDISWDAEWYEHTDKN